MVLSTEKAFKRGLAIGLSKQTLSIHAISDQLQVPQQTIYRWIKEFDTNGKRLPNKSPGRPRKTTIRSDRLLCRLALNHKLCSASQLRQQWRERVCVDTVYRRLRSQGLRKWKRAVVPYLSPANIEGRLRWCMTRAHWRDVWDRVRNINAKPLVAESMQQLREWVQLEWDGLSQEYLNGLILSLPRRVRAAIEAHGSHTKY